MSEWAQLRWVVGGGEARLLSIGAEAVSLESTTPSPPGSRIDGVLLSGSGRTVRVKVHSSKREASGRFRIDGRPIDLTKEAREELGALVQAGGAQT